MSRRRLGPLVLAAMTSQSLLVVLSPTLVQAGHEFGVSVGTVGQARAIAAASAVAASLLVAGLIDRLGLRSLMAAGAALAAVGSAATAAAPSLTAFLAAHVVSGIAFACLLSGALAGVAAFPREQSARAMSYVVGANALAWIVVGSLGGLLSDALTWRAAYAIPAALAVGALAASRRAAPLPVAAATGGRRGWLVVLQDSRARRWFLADLAAWAVWATVLTYGGAFLIERHGISGSAVGAAFAVAAAGFFFGCMRSPALILRFARRRLIIAGAVAMAVLTPLHFLVAPTVVVTVALLSLLAVCGGVRASASAGLGLAQMAGRPGAVMTAQTAVTQLGYLLAALVGAAILSASSYAALGLVLGAGLSISAALFVRVADPPAGVRPATRMTRPATATA